MSSEKPLEKLIGRDELIDELTRSGSGLRLVTGDSGIGKTAVLAAACRRSKAQINPEPRTVRFSESLDAALLGVLGEVACRIATDSEDMRDVVRRMGRATASVTTRYFDRLPSILLRRLLGVLQSHTGIPVEDFVEDLGDQMLEDSGLGVAEQARDARGEIAAETIGALIDALAERADGERLTLALDTREDVEEADRRLLADLAPRLPETASIWLALNTGTRAGHKTSVWLRESSPHVDELTVPPLSLADVRAWLKAVGVDERLGRRVHRASDGYPVVIEQLLSDEVDVAADVILKTKATEGFASLVRESLERLDPLARETTKKLALLRDPPPAAVAAALLGVDASELDDVRFQLEQARLLTVRVNGQPWFHERRRQAIVDFAMEPAERAATSDRLAQSALALALDDPSWARLLLPLELSPKSLTRLCLEAAAGAAHNDRVWGVLGETLRRSGMPRAEADRILAAAVAAGAMNDSLLAAIVRRRNRKLKFEAFREAIAQEAELAPGHIRSCFLALRDEAEPLALKAVDSKRTSPVVKAAALEALPKKLAVRKAKPLLKTAQDPTLLIALFRLLGRAAAPRARQALADPNAHRDVLAPALSALRPEEAAHHAAMLLDRTTDVGVAAACLRILGPRAAERARELIDEPKTPGHLVCVALDCLAEEERRGAAERLLDERQETELFCRCLECGGAKAAEHGERVLAEPSRYPKEVVAKSLALFGASMPEAVRRLLKEDSAAHVQARAIQSLGEEAAPFARRQLKRWREVNPTVLARCFQVAKETEESELAAQEILDEFDRSIPAALRAAALRNAPDTARRKELGGAVLAEWRRHYRPLVTAAMTAFWDEPGTAAEPCRQILGAWRNEVAFQREWPERQRYEAHILKALSNPICEPQAADAAAQIVAVGDRDDDGVPALLLKGAHDFLAGVHFPWSGSEAGAGEPAGSA